jgi:molybdopterin-containing oxidoreductase family membrane subunit
MATDIQVMGVFPDEEKTVTVIQSLKDVPWRLDRVHGPFPSHKISEALNMKKSPVGWFTLAGGILGFLAGFALAVYTAVEWNLIVWGKPIIAWIPFVIVGFEFTILFSVFGNVLGLIVLGDLPEFQSLKRYDPRCSGEHFTIVISCEDKEQEQVQKFFRDQGGEIRIFSEPAAHS